jgi:hypothetical protein
MSDSERATGAGAATGAGIRYQSRVAAWLAVHLLGEHGVEPPWELNSPFLWLSCEAPTAVDDVVAGTEDGGRIFVQAKRTLVLSGRDNSDLASALDQCVRQYLDALGGGEAGPPLDSSRDRLVVAAGPGSSGPIRSTLRHVLAKVRALPGGMSVNTAATNQGERSALAVLLGHVRRAWDRASGSPPADEELRPFLRLLWVDILAVEDDETEERRAKDLLRSALAESGQADAAWQALVDHCARLIATRGTVGRDALQDVLQTAGIRLRASLSYRKDIGRLQRHSSAVLARLADHSTILIGADKVVIERPYLPALRSAAEDGHLLITGEPGAGKSGAMYRLANALSADGRDVVVLVAQDPPFSTLGELRDELRLDHDVVDVLASWPGAEPAFLMIDALDAARTDAAGQALRGLIRQVASDAGRWRVVASIREYDVRYGRDTQRVFAGPPPLGPHPPLPGAEFTRVRHLVVGRLSSTELGQLASKSPLLHGLVSTAPAGIAELFTNPFNLRLAGELLALGTDPEAIRSVRSQLDLLDLYWSERVLGAGEMREADAREAVTRRAVDAMVQNRSLRVDRDRVADDPAVSSALFDLLRAHVLTEWAPRPGASRDRSTLTFSHHVLFDYAVARLLLRRSPERLAQLLREDPGLVLVARPSLLMHFQHLWDSDRETHETFWQAVLTISATPGIPEIGRLIGPSVAAGLVKDLYELTPLLVAVTPRES